MSPAARTDDDRQATHGVVGRSLAASPREGRTKASAARLSIVSNSALIALKIVAGAITGSIAILTEAVHSSIDLLASIVAYLSVRKADEPAAKDAISHRGRAARALAEWLATARAAAR